MTTSGQGQNSHNIRFLSQGDKNCFIKNPNEGWQIVIISIFCHKVVVSISGFYCIFQTLLRLQHFSPFWNWLNPKLGPPVTSEDVRIWVIRKSSPRQSKSASLSTVIAVQPPGHFNSSGSHFAFASSYFPPSGADGNTVTIVAQVAPSVRVLRTVQGRSKIWALSCVVLHTAIFW